MAATAFRSSSLTSSPTLNGLPHGIQPPTLAKTARKAFRDFKLYIKSIKPNSQAYYVSIISVVCIIISFIYIIISATTRRNTIAIRESNELLPEEELIVFGRPKNMKNITCSCPSSASNSLRRFEAVLSNSNLVFEGELVQVISNLWAQFRIKSVYRGLIRATDYDIVLPLFSLMGCYNLLEAEDGASGYEQGNRTYLVVTGKTFMVDAATTQDFFSSSLKRSAQFSDDGGVGYWLNMFSSLSSSSSSPETTPNLSMFQLATLRERNPSFLSSYEMPCGCNQAIFWNSLGTEYIKLVLQETEPFQVDWWRHKAKPHSSIASAPSSLQSMLNNLSKEQYESIVNGILRMAELAGLDEEWWSLPGISVFAACKDRNEILIEALESWRKAKLVDEIIVLDWSSKIPIRDYLREKGSGDLLSDNRIRILRVNDEPRWILSRAYNVAARATTRTSIFKADCDTLLQPEFFERNVLPVGSFMAGDWKSVNTSTDELHLNGLLFVKRTDFFIINGYDERIVTYGWDDTDIAKRLSGRGLAMDHFNDSFVSHIEHPFSLRLENQQGDRGAIIPYHNPMAAAVEIQRNRILGSRMGIANWDAHSTRVQYNVAVKPDNYVVLSAANRVASYQEIVAPDQLEESNRRSLRIILKDRFHFGSFPRSYTTEYLAQLLDRVAMPDKFHRVFVVLDGSCVERIIEYAAAMATVSRNPKLHVSYFWTRNAACNALFRDLFSYNDAEIFDSYEAKAVPEFYSIMVKWTNYSESLATMIQDFSKLETTFSPGSQTWVRIDPQALSTLNGQQKSLMMSIVSNLQASAEVFKSLGLYSLQLGSAGNKLIRQRVWDQSSDEQNAGANPNAFADDLKSLAERWRGKQTMAAFRDNVGQLTNIKECHITTSTLPVATEALLCAMTEIAIVVVGILNSNAGSSVMWWTP